MLIFLAISLLTACFQTSVQKCTMNPTFPPSPPHPPFTPLLFERLGLGDKDMVGKGDLGEVSVGVEEWFSVGAGGGASEFRFNAEGNFPFTLLLMSTRASTPSQGKITIKLGWMHMLDTQNLMEFGATTISDNDESDIEEDSDEKFVDASRAPGFLSANMRALRN
ncbi:hypothetical protein CVT25_008812 [Psilocybe cyanescens]|uniref:Uncharacterized protein n=1 Tax=Psilocybe cyanescens TaxID=93625 RepID=A0A409XN71_PSICY|nr:hypothetical protein CVT25_008812 [Psilocybe cyanescens]